MHDRGRRGAGPATPLLTGRARPVASRFPEIRRSPASRPRRGQARRGGRTCAGWPDPLATGCRVVYPDAVRGAFPDRIDSARPVKDFGADTPRVRRGPVHRDP